MRALLLHLVAGFHRHVLAHAPYSSPSAESSSLVPAAAVCSELRACLGLLLLGTEATAPAAGSTLAGGGASSSAPGLAPLLLRACQERGLSDATPAAGGSDGGGVGGGGVDGDSGGEYGVAKRECFAPLLALVAATAGRDVHAWRAAAGELEALCLAHGHLEGLFELATQVMI